VGKSSGTREGQVANIFFSYSHRDQGLRDELEKHLSLLKRQGVITAWHDRRIDAGGDLHREISRHLEEANIVLLLVSVDFLASDYCMDREMTRAMERAQSAECTVIPVILRPCDDWHSAPFGKFRATPPDGKPVSTFASQDEALSLVAADIRRAAQKYAAKRPAAEPAAPGTTAVKSREDSVSEGPRSSNLRIKRKFSDRDRDTFLEDSFEFMTRFFEGSLRELHKRNPQIEFTFKRLDGRSFTASLYEQGRRVATCSIWYGDGRGLGAGIYYSQSGEGPSNSYNESLTVADDGHTLFLKPLGISMHGEAKTTVSQEGAAEFYWDLLIRPLQD
jgi:hypothetical protein